MDHYSTTSKSNYILESAIHNITETPGRGVRDNANKNATTHSSPSHLFQQLRDIYDQFQQYNRGYKDHARRRHDLLLHRNTTSRNSREISHKPTKHTARHYRPDKRPPPLLPPSPYTTNNTNNTNNEHTYHNNHNTSHLNTLR